MARGATRLGRWVRGALPAAALLSILWSTGCDPVGSRVRLDEEGRVVASSRDWSFTLDPARLEIRARRRGGEGNEVVLAGPPEDAAPAAVTGLVLAEDSARWEQPSRRLTFLATFGEDALTVRVESAIEQRLEWPVTGAGPGARALIVPESEGLYLPVEDPFWIESAGECRSLWGSQLPFWGVEMDGAMLAYWVTEDLRTRSCRHRGPESSLSLVLVHEFLERDGLPALELHMGLAPETPVGPALAYRRWLVAQGRHASLADKIAANPEVGKLRGAMHAYLWGDGRSPEAIEELHDLGVARAFLSYDQDPRSEAWVVGEETIAAARAAGFLIGPYDTLNNIQPPATADAASSVYDEDLYDRGGVRMADGSLAGGFAGRGHHLSSEALKRYARDFVAERVDAAIAQGANAYFLDVDATGELYDDYDQAHPMTLGQDRMNRLTRMRFISETRGLVLGSESTAGWATPVIHVSHGTLTPKSPRLWQVLRDRALIGGYAPPERPGMHFREVQAPEDLVRLTFDPRYRLPLFETVYHDSVVATDFWGVALGKFTNVAAGRTLLLLLYGVPSLWHLDRKTLRDHGAWIAALDDFFSPLHRRIATEPLTAFEWLTPDRLVQRTRFGDVVTLTANFGGEPRGGIPPLCVEAEWIGEGRRDRYCAAPPASSGARGTR